MIIALLSDFGDSDGYAGVMKGVLLSRCPEARIVDISHNITPYSVSSSAYVLYTAWDWFPPGTIFLSVVDPGVGSARRECIATDGTRLVVTPDNGTLALVKRMNPGLRCFRAAEDILRDLESMKPPYSSTFDGRDLFAPLAAMAAKQLLGGEGIEEDNGRGETMVFPGDTFMFTIISVLCAREVEPVTVDQCRSSGRKGKIMHIDHFGNCITSIHRGDVKTSSGQEVAVISLPVGGSAEGSTAITVVGHFGEVPKGYPLAYWGSYGFLELAMREGNFAAEFSLSYGEEVTLMDPVY